MELLAEAASEKQARARKHVCLADCAEFKVWVPSDPVQNSSKATVLRLRVMADCLASRLPIAASQRVLGFLCAAHTEETMCPAEQTGCVSLCVGNHPEQLTLEEYDAFIGRRVSINIFLAAEVREACPILVSFHVSMNAL